MDKRMSRALIAALALTIFAFAARSAHAQAALQSTQIIVGAPSVPQTGGLATVQAVLADSKGRPISKAVIYFTTRAKFLSGSGDVLLDQAVTNAGGQAVGHFADDFSGTIVLQAEFRGDEQYAPSKATVQLGAAVERQAYTEHIGVDLPGFNIPPGGPPVASIGSRQSIRRVIDGLWPAMNGWPVAAVLILVWSMYFLAVTHVFRVAAAADESAESPTAESKRWP
jgi:hypothetical protein